MKKNLVSTLAIIAAATAVFGMTASADDVKQQKSFWKQRTLLIPMRMTTGNRQDMNMRY